MELNYDLVYEPVKPDTHRKCGCYAINPELLNQHQQQYILVPLKTSDYHLEIVNSIANVSLTQHYLNPTDKHLQIQYHFPINPNACIYRFSAQFGNTRIDGVVKEKEQAKKQYKEAVEQGKKAAYGEINPDSKDILTLKVGNVPPKQGVNIQISYLQELTLACNTFYQLHMIGTISPRYMNYIPGEHIKAGLRNQEAKSKGNFFWNFRISLKTTRKVAFFDSHTHDISLVSQNDTMTESEMTMTNASVPNKDFIFSFTTEDFQLPSYVFGRTDVGSTAMLSFIPKFCNLNLDDAYKASVVGKGFQTDIENAKGEYIFLLDRSGSMGGGRIEKAKEALVLFIKSLPQDTYFNIVSFGSTSERMFPSSVRYSDKEITSAVNKVKAMSSNLGGTEIYDPLHSLITQKPMEGYAKQIFLLTDGGVSNTQGVIKMVALNNKYSRVNTIGIGNGCSEELILGCARKGKGSHVFIGDNQNPSEKIIQLLTDSLSPVISKINLKFNKDLVESVIPNPDSMPYVLKNQLVNFFVTFKGQLQKPTSFQFSYEDSLNKLPFMSEIAIDPTVESESFIDRMGHFKRIRLLEESLQSNGNLQETMFYVKNIDKKAAIISESVKNQILSEFTAFICVQKELIDGQYQEIKDQGQIKVQIQNPKAFQEKYQGNALHQVKRKGMSALSGPLAPAASYQRSMMPMAMQSISMDRSRGSRDRDRMAPSRPLQKKKQSSGGFFDNIVSFFKPATKSESRGIERSEFLECKKMKFQENMMDLQCEEQDQDDAIDMACQRQRMQDIYIGECSVIASSSSMKMKKVTLQQATKGKQVRKKQKRVQKAVSINEIVDSQTAEGSWKDISLIGLLLGDNIQEIIAKEANLAAVITYLIARWIQKFHPQPQYRLVVKKGLSFAKNNSQSLQSLGAKYDQYVQ